MSSHTDLKSPEPPVELLQERFLAILPTIVSIARLYFRIVPCRDRREDCVSEAVALAWLWHRQLAARGRDPSGFAVTFARLAARAVGSGRRLCGQQSARDVMAQVCQRRKGFFVATIPDNWVLPGTFEDALAENTQSPVPVQVQFRSDFPAWKGSLPVMKQQAVEQLAAGHNACDVARVLGVSRGRVSQMRKELRRDYLHFLGDGTVKKPRVRR